MKLTQEYLLALVDEVQYHHFDGTTVTVCCIKMKSGFTVTGDSACINASDFNAASGRSYAYVKAFEKIWELEDYRYKKALMGAD